MPKLKDLLETALRETLTMNQASIDAWRQERPGAPFGPSIAAGDEMGSYRTSESAMAALAEIADQTLANDAALQRTTSVDTARLQAASTLGELLNELAAGTDADANWATYKKRYRERLGRGKGRITHYFPVWLFTRQQVPDFDIGPVSFRSPETWIDEVERRRGQRSSWMDGVLGIWNGTPVSPDVPVAIRSVARSVRPDQWVACVTLEGFEKAEAYRRARTAARAALNVLRLLVAPPDNARIRLAADHGPPGGVDRLSQRDGEDLAHGGSINWGGLSGPPGMAANIVGSNAAFLAAAGARIAVTLSPDPKLVPCPELSERFVNALHWFGRGCMADADFEALVDMAIALDVLSGGLQEPGILELSARLMKLPRAHVMISDGTTLKQLVSRIYGYRSEIAHGSILALDEHLRTERGQAEAFASAMLGHYADMLDPYAAAGGSDDRDDFRKSLPPVPPDP
ncbi:HEPN domain-containing protein [Methylobacterium organophilum]|uniref:HEPN domain-containing protein n=1 Tax=Methylobacterium organophilum TaxID=410 RepID=UPI001F13793D|nr:HEPN domain-containing protein [Methylobacterium organophilum]UMY18793.1 HEPN domain-containing protein [Methylobacterium organophilum]